MKAGRLLLSIAIFAACSGAPSAVAPASSTTVGGRDGGVAARCEASPASGTAIDGLTVAGGGTFRNVFAVPLTDDGQFRYVVAAEIDGRGMEGDGEIGTWALGELGGGPIVAANSIAQEFSEWGAAAGDGSPMDLTRDAVARSAEASAAEECVRSGP